MRQRRWLLVMLVVGVLFSGGCMSRAIKEGAYAVLGSSGRYVLLDGDEAEMKTLSEEYGAVEVESFRNTIGDAAPHEFVNLLPVAIRAQLKYLKDEEDGRKLFCGPANRTLVIRGSIIHYDVGGTIDKVLGPIEDAICRVQFHDGRSGTLLAEANCTGRVKSSVRNGPKEMAEGVGKAIRKLLKPKEEEKEPQQGSK